MQLLGHSKWLLSRQRATPCSSFFLALFRLWTLQTLLLVDTAVRLCCTYQSNDSDDQNSLQPVTVNEPLSHSSHRPPQTLSLSRLLYSQMCLSVWTWQVNSSNEERNEGEFKHPAGHSCSRGRPVTRHVSQWGMTQSLPMFAGVNLHDAHANDQRCHIIHTLRLCLFYLTCSRFIQIVKNMFVCTKYTTMLF